MDTSFLENYTILGALITALTAFIYRIYRIFKIDRNQDSLNKDEENFRKFLLDENKSLRDISHILYIEKSDLVSKIARLEEQVKRLEEQIYLLTNQLQKYNNIGN